MDIFDDIARAVQPPPVQPTGGSRLERDYATPFNTWNAQKTPENMTSLIQAVHPVIDSAVRPLGDSPILRSRAKQIAIKAFQNYDPSRASLRTHLMNQLQGLQRIAAQQASAVRVPERVVLQKRHVDRETANFIDEFGRDPSDKELATRVGLPVARIQYVRQWRPAISASRAAGPEDDAPAVLGQDNTAMRLAQQFVYDELSPTDQLIFDFSTGSNGRERLQGRQVAARLGVTPSAISQRLAAIQKRFDSAQDMELFGG